MSCNIEIFLYVEYLLLTDSDVLGDFWSLDLPSLEWTQFDESKMRGKFPSKRHSMGFTTAFGDILILFGGRSAGTVANMHEHVLNAVLQSMN